MSLFDLNTLYMLEEDIQLLLKMHFVPGSVVAERLATLESTVSSIPNTVGKGMFNDWTRRLVDLKTKCIPYVPAAVAASPPPPPPPVAADPAKAAAALNSELARMEIDIRTLFATKHPVVAEVNAKIDQFATKIANTAADYPDLHLKWNSSHCIVMEDYAAYVRALSAPAQVDEPGGYIPYDSTPPRTNSVENLRRVIDGEEDQVVSQSSMPNQAHSAPRPPVGFVGNINEKAQVQPEKPVAAVPEPIIWQPVCEVPVQKPIPVEPEDIEPPGDDFDWTSSSVAEAPKPVTCKPVQPAPQQQQPQFYGNSNQQQQQQCKHYQAPQSHGYAAEQANKPNDNVPSKLSYSPPPSPVKVNVPVEPEDNDPPGDDFDWTSSSVVDEPKQPVTRKPQQPSPQQQQQYSPYRQSHGNSADQRNIQSNDNVSIYEASLPVEKKSALVVEPEDIDPPGDDFDWTSGGDVVQPKPVTRKPEPSPQQSYNHYQQSHGNFADQRNIQSNDNVPIYEAPLPVEKKSAPVAEPESVDPPGDDFDWTSGGGDEQKQRSKPQQQQQQQFSGYGNSNNNNAYNDDGYNNKQPQQQQYNHYQASQFNGNDSGNHHSGQTNGQAAAASMVATTDDREEDPVKQQIKEEIRAKMVRAFGRIAPMADEKDLDAAKKVYQLLLKVRRVIDAFGGRRQPLQQAAAQLACTKLAPAVLSSIDPGQQASLSVLCSSLAGVVKNLAEEKAREPRADDEFGLAELFDCSFCKNKGHTSRDCPVIRATLCWNCLKWSHNSRRCPDERVEAEMINF